MSHAVEVTKIAPYLAAEIKGVDLTHDVSEEEFQVLHDALMGHGVLVFQISLWMGIARSPFGKRFGELSVHPFSPHQEDLPELIIFDNDEDNPPFGTDCWHSGETFREEPPLGTMLLAKIIPAQERVKEYGF